MNDSSFQGVKVLGMLPGSPSEQAGVQVGDVILAVDNVAVTTLQEYVDRASLRKGDMKLDIFRNNSLLEIVVPSGLTEDGDIKY